MKACPENNEARKSHSTDGWIGVDLDGTLAVYDGWKGVEHIGDPVPLMVDRVKRWLAEGITVKIVTARISEQSCRLNGVPRTLVLHYIDGWCAEHIGQPLEVTSEKDLDMIELWDDRAVQVIPNTGQRVDNFCNLHMVEIEREIEEKQIAARNGN